jgi:D-alanyl-D-alanine carboxypeptidase/D-alanyl-D-alanine-endopeptidase (penicillin-binding protein 4)
MHLAPFALSGLLAFAPLAGAAEDQPAPAPSAAVAKPASPVVLVPRAVVIGADFGFAPDDFGYLVVDLADGRVVAALNADEPFMPASVCKVPTAAAALDILGPDHRFQTTVLIDGEVVDGVLDGVLTLRGGGDPVLTGDDLQALAKGIAAAGIKKVGEFRYDATELVETPQISAQQPEVVGYNPGVSALSVNFNRVRLMWRNGDKGPSGEARAVSDNVTLALDAIHFAPADAPLPGPFAHAGQPADDTWVLSPELSSSGEDWLPVRDPARVAAAMLRLLAAKEGLTLPEPTPGAVSPEAREIARHESPDLAEIIRRVLRSSNNLAAELIGLAASRAITGRPLTLEASAETLANYWRLRIDDIDWDGFFLENQSGLSSRSRATPRQLVAILQAASDPVAGANLYPLLRAASWTAPNGKTVRIRAKTGTIAYGRGLAGYIDAADGRRLAFAVFFNDFEHRAALDAAFDPRVEARDSGWRSWRARALKLEEKLIDGWATGS